MALSGTVVQYLQFRILKFPLISHDIPLSMVVSNIPLISLKADDDGERLNWWKASISSIGGGLAPQRWVAQSLAAGWFLKVAGSRKLKKKRNNSFTSKSAWVDRSYFHLFSMGAFIIFIPTQLYYGRLQSHHTCKKSEFWTCDFGHPDPLNNTTLYTSTIPASRRT